MAQQKSGIAMASKMILYTTVLPVALGGLFAFGVWIWTLLT